MAIEKVMIKVMMMMIMMMMIMMMMMMIIQWYDKVNDNDVSNTNSTLLILCNQNPSQVH